MREMILSTPLVVVLSVMFGYFLRGLVDMWRYGNFFIFPSRGHCVICRKRMFAWQKTCNRDWDMMLNDGFMAEIVSFGALTHASCTGDPSIETVKEIAGWNTGE